MITVTKRFRFEASHYLPNYNGKCSELHGHSYLLEITVKSIKVDKINPTRHKWINPKTGMVMDFGDLKSIVQKYIIEKLDHKHLNPIIRNPTAENTILFMVDILNVALPQHIRLHHVRLWETHDSHADWSEEE
jgi:6-pyruvoyltetrahydropterin/6-carboxytetrahydropterin synthase